MSDRVLAMETFVRVAEGGSLSSAARVMGKSLAAVSRTLSQLEQRLGVRLLHRSTRKVTLTEAGAAFHDSAKRILGEIDEAETSLGDRAAAPRGTVRITAPLLFGRMHVAPVVHEMLAQFPEVGANLTLADRNVNLVEEGVDVAVRIGWLEDSALVARKLAEVPRVVCAARSYLRRRGTPTAPEDLRRHECLRFTGLAPGVEWGFRRAGKEFRVAIGGRLACNVGEPIIDAARGGMGIMMALHYQVADDLAAGTLVRLLPKFEPPPLPVHALYQSPRLMAVRVRVFLDLLTLRIPERLAPPAPRADPAKRARAEARPTRRA